MNGIYQHFRPEEKQFIDSALDWIGFVERTYTEKLTDFLDPRQQFILQSVLGEGKDAKLSFFGGAPFCERKRALICPDYMEPQADDFHISVHEIDYPRKFITLEHRMVLGSIMSLGIKRDKFGDIIVNGDRIQFFSCREIDGFLTSHLKEIGRASVALQKIPLEKVMEREEEWDELETTAASLRLDAVLSAVFSISRKKAQSLIAQKLVKLNWKVVEQPAAECYEGDMISARKLGRCKIISVLGETRKNKLRIKAGIIK
jgi:RNA-binding protein YlmH